MKRAFTMAEVLITIGLLGVIIAMTLPGLMVKYQKYSAIQQLKIAYSILSKAIDASKEDHEDIQYWDFNLGTEGFVNEYLAPYLNLSKIGAYDSPSNPRVDYFFYYLGANTRDITNQSVSLHSTAKAFIYSLSNGMLVTIAVYKSHTFGIWTCVMRVDVNGFAKPNMLGKDVFTFSVTEKYRHLTPGVANQYDHYKYTVEQLLESSNIGGCNIKASSNWGTAPGDACSVVIMKDGWKIRKDYPW